MPSATPSWNSRRNIQRIDLKNTLASTQRVLRVLYPPGNDTVLDVTVTAGAASNASMLLHPLLGLNISVNGVGLPQLVQVSGGQSAASQLQGLLQAALRLGSMDVGIELMPTQGQAVTFRVAVPQAKVCFALCVAMRCLPCSVACVRAPRAARGRAMYGMSPSWLCPCTELCLALQVANLTMSATLEAIRVPPTSPQPTCPNTTCYYATPVWVPGNSTDPGWYVPTYPTFPVPSTGGACADSGINGGAGGADDNSTAAVALSLDGLSVAVAAVVVPGVDIQGTLLSFWGADPFNTTTRAWNASAEDVAAAVRWAITGFDPSVTRERCVAAWQGPGQHVRRPAQVMPVQAMP